MRNIIVLLAVLLSSFVAEAQPTFSKDIAPIIYNQCTTCHRQGEIGPQSFTNYEEVKNHAATIKYATSIRFMPPWQADPSYSELQNENYLSDEQIQLIADWVDAGSPQGDPADEPPLPDFPEGSLIGEPDLVLSFAQSHTHIGNNLDEYRYFVLPTGLTEEKIVKAIEFRPGNAKIVHHALIFEDLEGVAAATDATTPEYGFEGFGGFNGGSELDLLSQKQYPGYVPGQKPIFYPDGLGQTLGAGADLAVQVHYAPIPNDEVDSSSVNIFFKDNDEDVSRFVQNRIMLPFNLIGGPNTFFLLPNQVKEFHGTYTPTTDISLLGLSPHMHLLGQDWEIYVEHQDGSISNLISIPDWDFNWQGDYYFKKFVVIKAGDTVHAKASYDNTSENPDNPSNPPQFVTWGEYTTDEMYYLPLFFVDYKAGDENIIFGETTSLEDLNIIQPENKIFPIAPNPVRGMMNAGFELEQGSVINISIRDIQGRIVRNIRKNEFYGIGKHIINIDSDQLSNGMYLLQIEGKDFSLSEKFVKQ